MSQAAGRKSARRAHTAVGHAFKAPPAPRHDAIAAGLRAFFEIKEKWQLSYEEAKTLLGQPGKSTYYNWQRGQVGDVVHRMDLATRLSYVLGIYKALNEIYEHAELADSWVASPTRRSAGNLPWTACWEDRSSIWRGCANTSTASEARVPRQTDLLFHRAALGGVTKKAHPLENDVSAAVGASPSGRCFRTRRADRGQGGAVRIGTDDRSRSTAGHRHDQLGAALPSRLRTGRLGADVAFHASEQGQRQPLHRRHIRRLLRRAAFETALREVAYHRGRFHAQTRDEPTRTTFKTIEAGIDKVLHDIRAGDWSDLLDPDPASYAMPQAFAAGLRETGSLGIVYPSVRHRTGECVAAFWPNVMTTGRGQTHCPAVGRQGHRRLVRFREERVGIPVRGRRPR